ncbi:lytic transglycosylase domain-containing protein [Actinoplanes subtropicus]|uniref:lytic transglycosylase domain-containing protein n=1 Tax=Actinoplanes subtropicus TaxID=543632 RepID=UPI0004C45356|nr:hypothetical protein [Actinoplanes subtropicus]
MANGRKTPMGQPELRASAPHRGGPLGSSGAAPEAAPATTQATKSDIAEKSEAKTDAVPAAKATDEGKTEVTPAVEGKSEATPAAEDKSEAKPEVTPPSEAAGEGKTEVVPPDAAKNDRKPDVAPPNGTKDDGKTDAVPLDAAKDDGKTEAAAKGDGADKPPTTPTATPTSDSTSDPKATPPAPRRAHPVQAVARAGRSTSAWAKRPSGRLVLPGVIVLLLLGAAGTAGAYLVPQALDATPAPSATPAFGAGATAASAPPVGAAAGLPTGSAPIGPSGAPAVTTPAGQGQNGQRPADALEGWAQQIGTKVSIPVVALEAYGYAALVLEKTTPSCHLSWTTIAALGKVESDHGSANGAVLGADGEVQPPIYGLPLDGKGGRQLVRDTDQGTIDGDTTYDRAVGPLQFVPQTWNSYKMDADNNGVADPNDIYDASLTAASYLCQGGRDLSKGASWWDAILSYNAVQPYAQKVFEAANDYGQRSQG